MMMYYNEYYLVVMKWSFIYIRVIIYTAFLGTPFSDWETDLTSHLTQILT